MKTMILPDLLNSEWASGSEMISDFKRTPYYTQLMHTCKTLNRSVIYESELHGLDHIERVILLGALIAWKVSLSDADMQLLMAACSYHDIGRIDDSVDNEHGRRSAEMLRDLRIQSGKPVWIELGLQTIHERTAERIHRGYDLAVFEDAYTRLKEPFSCGAAAGAITRATFPVSRSSSTSSSDSLARAGKICWRPFGISLI